MSTACGVVASAMIVAAVLVTCQLIFVRFVLNGSTIWQTEAVTYLMIAATLIGLPYVQLLRGHVNVDLLRLLLPSAASRALTVAILLVTIAIAALMVWHGAHLFYLAYERNWRSDTVWGARLAIPYLALPIGFGLYALQLFADIVSPDDPDVGPRLDEPDAPNAPGDGVPGGERVDAGFKEAARWNR